MKIDMGSAVSYVQSLILSDEPDIDSRLSTIRLTRTGLMEVVAVAIAESANATSMHALNAAGTFAYHHGLFALRSTFIGDDWVIDREGGIESIYNKEAGVRVAFSNVDAACNPLALPKPRSRKGAGAERASGALLFDDLPEYAPSPVEGEALYYLMVDERGFAELTRPVVKGGKFAAAIERLFLGRLDFSEPAADLPEQGAGGAITFDPPVTRKQ